MTENLLFLAMKREIRPIFYLDVIQISQQLLRTNGK